MKTTDDKTKKTETVWLDREQGHEGEARRRAWSRTGEAHIAKDERIVVIVNHDAETKMLATEIRLAPAH